MLHAFDVVVSPLINDLPPPTLFQVVNYSTCVSAEEICEASSKLITFIDLAGHQKYMKTTVFGLTAHRPDFAMLVVAANSGVGECAREGPAWRQSE